MIKKAVLTLLFLTGLFGVTGCSTLGYYQQSVIGHLKILWKKKDISSLQQDPSVDSKLKTRLQKVLEIRQFASEHLALPDNNSYRQYTDIHRDSVVWNVFAAPEFSIKPKTWCYFIVGCVSYRGYYDQNEANSTAEELSYQGYDVSVDGIPAYSTLGWFSDPILNTVVYWSDDQLTRLIFHELAHQIIYIKGDADFNEAFASSVETLGTVSWIKKHDPEHMNAFLKSLERKTQFRDLLAKTRDELLSLYQQSMPESAKRAQKQAIFQDMKENYLTLKQQWNGYNGYDYWFSKPINNARLTASMTYLNNIPAFYQLFIETNGDWHLFYQRVLTFENLSDDARNTQITALREKHLNFDQLVSLVN